MTLMRFGWLLLFCVSLLAACTPGKPVAAPTPQATVSWEGGRVILPEGLSGQLPPDTQTVGWLALLPGVTDDVASISFVECPTGAPDSGCIGNHRAIAAKGTTVLAGQPVSRFDATFMKSSGAADTRSWLEHHAVVLLPSGRRIDIVGQVLIGSGQEARLRAVYEQLLENLEASPP